MDWENEPWVKLYTRNTAELVVIGWEARAYLWELMRVCDRAGFVDTEDPEELAVLCHMPSQVVTACHGTLLARGIIEKAAGGVLIRNFLEAQSRRTSDKERQRRSRELRRLSKQAGHELSQGVTGCHSESQGVTDRIDKTDKKEEIVARKRAKQIPSDWEPTDAHRERAAESGVDLEREAEKFRAHHEAKGSKFKNWNSAFTTWLMNAEEYQANRKPAKRYRPELEML